MKIAKALSSIMIAASVLSVASLTGCASTPTKEGTGEYIDDSVITAKVKASLFNEPTLKATEINVETFKGDVQLSGFVAEDRPADDSARGADAWVCKDRMHEVSPVLQRLLAR